MLYSHFYIEHLRSHHKWVSTPLDPSTSRFNEGLYAFYLRSIPSGYVATWKIEAERLQKEGKSQFSLENRMISFNLLHALYIGVIYTIFGGLATLFHLVYSFFIVLMLEAINYLEHYGLQRKLDANGNYESVSIKHSWNAPQVITNWVLFKLQRHSDHHANSYKPYQILESFPESPMLPYGYSVSIILSFIPPIWKKVINPLAEATNKDEKLPEDVRISHQRWILGTLCIVSLVFTYITFFVIGFHER